MDAYIEERLKQYIDYQIELERKLGKGIHKYVLAKRLLGDFGDENEDIELIRNELGIKKRSSTAKQAYRLENSVPTVHKAVYTIAREPPYKPSFDDMFSERPRSKKVMSTEPATFYIASDMAGGAYGSLQDAVRTSAYKLYEEATQQAEVQNQPKEDSYVRKLTESGIILSPKETLASIFGMANEKRLLTQTIILPLYRPELFRGMTVYKKILMHSLPGCGKTFLVRCIAGETRYPLISLYSSAIFNKYIGESERYLRAAFALAASKYPSILFIDEIDAFCKSRSDSDSETNYRVKNELLYLIDGLEKERVTFIGATNLPYALDPAVRRRFDKRVFVALPDDEARRCFLASKLEIGGATLSQFVKATHNYNFADLNNVVNCIQGLPIEILTKATHFRKQNGKWTVCESHEAGAQQLAVTEINQGEEVQVPQITDELKLYVLARVHSSVTETDMQLHYKFQGEFGSE